MKRKATLIFYVGNGAVKCGIVETPAVSRKNTEQEPLRVLKTRAAFLPAGQSRDREQLESRIINILNDLVRDIRTKDLTLPEFAGISITDVRVVLASPWYTSQTVTIRVSQDEPFTVTQKMIDKAVSEHVEQYMRDDGGQIANEIRVLEQKKVYVALNGYRTNAPQGKKAKAVDILLFLSFAKKDTIEKITELIEAQFPIKQVHISSQSLVSFTVIDDLQKKMSQYVIADVTSELTELMVVRNSQIAEVASFPLGRHFIDSTLAKYMHVTEEVASSFMTMSLAGTLDTSVQTQFNDALVQTKKDWLAVFSEVLGDISANSTLPSTFFLFAPGDVFQIFSDFILSEEYQQFAFSEGRFRVVKVKPEDFTETCVVTTGVERDLAIVTGAVFNTLE